MSHLIAHIRTTLQGTYPPEEATAIARLLAEELYGFSQLDIYMGKDRKLSVEEQQKLENILTRLQNHEPVQHILGYTDFCGRRFKVNRHVLIPRPETAELVNLILCDHPTPPARVLDIGTGSGCIPITLAHHWPESDIHAWDISPEALETARLNNALHTTQVDFQEHDILHYEDCNEPPFDLIVSNPPYIKDAERTMMERNVLDWEPHLALFVPDNDPLRFYRAITSLAATNLLRPKGRLYFEINRAHGADTIALLHAYGFSDITLLKDLSGNDRIVRGIRK